MGWIAVDDLVGFIDVTGKVVIPPVYRCAHPFSEGLAKVNDDWKFGFIDRTGKWVIKPVYERASDFNDGVSVVRFLS